jgi:hypothetical protein
VWDRQTTALAKQANVTSRRVAYNYNEASNVYVPLFMCVIYFFFWVHERKIHELIFYTQKFCTSRIHME